MARFIRWQGMIAFMVLSALVVVFIYLFAESLVKKAIVSSAESAFGAEVNVAEVQLSYSPLQLSVLGLQVTDKETYSRDSCIILFASEYTSPNPVMVEPEKLP